MCHCCNDALLKALPGGDDIWRPHESPFIRSLIEKWTSHGLDKFGSLQAELTKWVSHTAYKAGPAPVLKPGAFVRWNPGELAAAKLYLESVPPEEFSLDDWMLVIDYLVQKYLPHDVMMQDAQWQATRAAMMGRVQANMAAVAVSAADRLAAALPTEVAVVERQFGLSVAQKAAIEFGQARCCQYVTNISEALRGKLKLAVLDWQEKKFLGVASSIAKRDLQGKLLDAFADANRDWRRLALTEAGEMANQGFLASLPAGTQVKRIEQYHGACAWCRSIDGRIFTVVPSDKKDKDGETEVWAGKNNIGRSSSLNKRTAEGLVARTAAELWWPAAGVQHPHCRGRWVRVVALKTSADPQFAAWLQQHLAKKG